MKNYIGIIALSGGLAFASIAGAVVQPELNRVVDANTGSVVVESPPAAVINKLEIYADATNPFQAVASTPTGQIWPWDKTTTATTGGCNPCFSWAGGNLNSAEQWMVNNSTPALVKADTDLNNAYSHIVAEQVASKTSPNIFTNSFFRAWVAERDANIEKAIAANMKTDEIIAALSIMYQQHLNYIKSEM